MLDISRWTLFFLRKLIHHLHSTSSSLLASHLIPLLTTLSTPQPQQIPPLRSQHSKSQSSTPFPSPPSSSPNPDNPPPSLSPIATKKAQIALHPPPKKRRPFNFPLPDSSTLRTSSDIGHASKIHTPPYDLSWRRNSQLKNYYACASPSAVCQIHQR